jgi:hypothetical protein
MRTADMQAAIFESRRQENGLLTNVCYFVVLRFSEPFGSRAVDPWKWRTLRNYAQLVWDLWSPMLEADHKTLQADWSDTQQLGTTSDFISVLQ